MSEYWNICMGEILNEAGISFTDAQLKEVVENVMHAKDMEWEATGQEHIPNPLEAELSQANRRVEQERMAREKTERDFIANICMRHNCDPSQVTLESNGHATVWK